MLEQLKLLYHLILRHCLLGRYWFKLTYQGLAKFMKIQYKLFKLETVLLSLNLFCFKTFSILILRFFCRLIKIVCNRLTSSINCYKLITYSTLFVQLQEMLCLGCSNPMKVMLAFQSYMHLCEGKLIFKSCGCCMIIMVVSNIFTKLVRSCTTGKTH